MTYSREEINVYNDSIAYHARRFTMKQKIVPLIGIAAFIIGGLIVRQKTLDGIETLEKTFAKKSDPPAELQD